MFKMSEIPYNDFAKIGVSAMEIGKLPQRTLNALLSGQKTELMKFTKVPNISDGFEGRLSLKRTGQGVPTLEITPVKRHLNNKYNLTETELKQLQETDRVSYIRKEFINSKTQSPYQVLIGIDKDTNNLIAFNPAKLKAPGEINNTPLTEKQKLDFKNGREVDIAGDKYIANPNSELGITNSMGDSRKIVQIKTENYSYNEKQLAMDLAFAASAIGSIIMVGHLVRLANSTVVAHRKNSENPEYLNSFENISRDIERANKSNNKSFLPQTVIKEIVNSNLKKFDLGVYDGKLKDYGVAPYKNEKDASTSFFVTLEKDGKERTMWGKDLQNAVEKSNVKKGDEIKLEYQGSETVKINTVENGKTVEKTAKKNIWEIYTPERKQEYGESRKISAKPPLEKVDKTDDLKTAKTGNTTHQTQSSIDTLKENNPSIKKVVVEKKTKTGLEASEKPKVQEKKRIVKSNRIKM